MSKRLVPVVMATALLVGACGDDSDAEEATTDASATAGAAAGDDGDAAVLQLASTDLGEVVVDGEGRVVYLFVPDGQGPSTCYDQCEANWPAVAEVTTVGAGLESGLVGTTTRTDGDSQATYNGWPLYHFAGDAAAGDTNGQGVNGVWYVLDAGGDAVGAEPPASGTAPGY